MHGQTFTVVLKLEIEQVAGVNHETKLGREADERDEAKRNLKNVEDAHYCTDYDPNHVEVHGAPGQSHIAVVAKPASRDLKQGHSERSVHKNFKADVACLQEG